MRIRTHLAALVGAVALAAALIPAHAGEVSDPNHWEKTLPSEMCLKDNFPESPFTVPNYPGNGWELDAVIVGTPAGHEVLRAVAAGTVIGGDLSWVIVCKSRWEPTPTPTPTVTITATPEPAPTETVTVPGPTATATATVTEPAPTVTATETVPGPTATATATVTETPAPAPTVTATSTATITAPPVVPTASSTAECELDNAAESRMCESIRDFPMPLPEESESASSTTQPAPAKPGLPDAGV